MRFELSRFPRVPLAHLPTPLEPLDRLSKHLGGPRIWIKRDDCTGLATGGNKTRKLEFLIGEALAHGADTVITFGAVQSNHARQTAAACARYGLQCHLVLSRAVQWPQADYEVTGNVLLERITGAHIHIVAPADAPAHAAELTATFERRGNRVYRIPTGGSNVTGALGYVACAYELLDQAKHLGFHPDLVLHASSSGGTQAGLAVGLHATGTELVGINVSDALPTTIEARVNQLARATFEYLGGKGTLPDCSIRHEFLGSGYGMPTASCLNAIRTLGELEGIIADPVYSGKALDAMASLDHSRTRPTPSHVLYIHTGGTGALPAYGTSFQPMSGAKGATNAFTRR
jgi:L-cysteate sulfo-lyase